MVGVHLDSTSEHDQILQADSPSREIRSRRVRTGPAKRPSSRGSGDLGQEPVVVVDLEAVADGCHCDGEAGMAEANGDALSGHHSEASAADASLHGRWRVWHVRCGSCRPGVSQPCPVTRQGDAQRLISGGGVALPYERVVLVGLWSGEVARSGPGRPPDDGK